MKKNDNPRAYIMACLDKAYEEYPTLVGAHSEQIQYDTSQIGDMFGHLFERGLELSLLDAEEKIERDEDLLEDWRGFVRKAIADYGKYDSKTQHYIEVGIRFKKEIEDYKSFVDNLNPMEEEEADLSLYTYMEMYIDRMSLADMACAYDTLEQQQKTKAISWYTYVKCGLALTSRLAYNTPEKCGWWAECDRLKEMNQTHHRKTVSYEDRFFGEMSFSMEDAIDRMRAAREYATLNYMSVEEAWYQLQEEMEKVDPM